MAIFRGVTAGYFAVLLLTLAACDANPPKDLSGLIKTLNTVFIEPIPSDATPYHTADELFKIERKALVKSLEESSDANVLRYDANIGFRSVDDASDTNAQCSDAADAQISVRASVYGVCFTPNNADTFFWITKDFQDEQSPTGESAYRLRALVGGLYTYILMHRWAPSSVNDGIPTDSLLFGSRPMWCIAGRIDNAVANIVSSITIDDAKAALTSIASMPPLPRDGQEPNSLLDQISADSMLRMFGPPPVKTTGMGDCLLQSEV